MDFTGRIVGDSGTGKTSFVNKYILNKFADTYQATIPTQFSSKILEIDGIKYRLQFWDIAGQDSSDTTTNIFCKNTNGVVLCCEINDKNTLGGAVVWKNSMEQNMIDGMFVWRKREWICGRRRSDYNIWKIGWGNDGFVGCEGFVGSGIDEKLIENKKVDVISIVYFLFLFLLFFKINLIL